MSEYTPTPEEVRHEFVLYRDDLSEEESRGRFDRMLAAHDAEVARAAKAEAWDEGVAAQIKHIDEWVESQSEARIDNYFPLENPHRKVATDE